VRSAKELTAPREEGRFAFPITSKETHTVPAKATLKDRLPQRLHLPYSLYCEVHLSAATTLNITKHLGNQTDQSETFTNIYQLSIRRYVSGLGALQNS
jgi:hypothetical protein